MDDVPLPILVFSALLALFGITGLVYPFRPKRLERLFYARWQRTDSRRVEIAVVWPLGLSLIFAGAWIVYGFASPEHESKWPVFAALSFYLVWGAGAVALAWARREPDDGTPSPPHGGPRRVVVEILLALALGTIAAGHLLWSETAGFSRPRESLLHFATFPIAGALAGLAGFIATRGRRPAARLATAVVILFAAWGVAEVSYWPGQVLPQAARYWQELRHPIEAPSVPSVQENPEPTDRSTSLAFGIDDVQLGDKGASVESVDIAGGGLTAIEEIWKSKNGPMTASDRIYLDGKWKPKPKGYWGVLGRPDGGVLMLGNELRWIDESGKASDSFERARAGSPVVILSDSIIYSIDEDDDAEAESDPKLLSEGIFATDYDGDVIWRAASDTQPRFRDSVFSVYGASRTNRDTALVVVYGVFPPDEESLALYEVDPDAGKLTRLPLPKEAFGTKAVVELGDGWLCALGSYDDGDGRHNLRAWRRDGTGSVLVTKVPALKGWINWRIRGGTGEFLTWEDGTVRRIVPRLT